MPADHLGTPTSMYNEEGETTWERSLDSNGKVKTGDNSSCPFLFQGQYYDEEIELAYNRFRYYSPDTGTYLSKDPIGLNSREYNLYAYVSDTNSIIDPFGLDWNYVLIDSNGNSYYHGRASENASMQDVANRHSKTTGTDGARFGEGDTMQRKTGVETDPEEVKGIEQRGIAENDLLGRGSDKVRGNKINGMSEAKQGKEKGKRRLNLADKLLKGKKVSELPTLEELKFKRGCNK